MFNRVCLAGLVQALLSWQPPRTALALVGVLLAFGGPLAWGQNATVQPSSPGADSTYAIGDNIDFTVGFPQAVTVMGAPVLVFQIGGASDKEAAYVTGDSTPQQLVFRYLVEAGDLDEDGISMNADALMRGTIVLGTSATPAVRTLDVPSRWSNHRVDGVTPTVESSAISSRAGTYKKGDAIDVRVAFSERVNARHAPKLQLAIQIGADVRQAYLHSGDGSRNLTFRYRVQDDDVDEDGISITTDAFNGGTYRDAAGNGSTMFQVPPNQAQHQVDGDEPEITTVAITSRAGDDDTYGQGDTIDLDVTFDQAVTVQGSPELLLVFFDDSDRPGPRRRARLVRRTPTVLTFSYVVAAGDIDRNGISVGEDPLVGGTIRDAAGNLADRSFGGFSDNSEHQVDAVAPEPTNVLISSTPRNGHTYGEGEAIEVSVTFDEEVSVTGSPTLGLSIGAYTRAAPYATGSGTRTLVFRYQVQAVDSDDDGISIGPTAFVGGVIQDRQGIAIARGTQPVAPQPRHRVDGGFTPPPGVVDVRFTSSPRSPTSYYTEGEVIEVMVRFSSVVFVTEPREPDEDAELRLVLGIGEHSRFAAYVEGSGTATLIFRYTVAEGDLDVDGIAISPASPPGPAALVGGRIEDADGAVANRYFRGLPANPAHRVDAVPLVAVSTTVRNPPGDGSYGLGEFIEVAVQFDEPVFVDEANGQLDLVLGIGTRSPTAEFVDGGGTDTLVFRYVVRQGDLDTDGISIGPNALVGASMVDRAGNEWMAEGRRIPPLSPQARHQVNAGEDGVAPRIRSVDIATLPDGGTFTLDAPITVHVAFTEAVFVTGQPTVALSVGALVRDAAFVSGSGTATLVFRYVVQQEDFDDDGISIGPLALAGGTIVDAGGNAALRDSRPLLAQRNARVEGGGDGAPAIGDVVVVTDPPANHTHIIGDAIEVEITFNQVVHVTGVPTLALSIGADTRQAAYRAGSGTTQLRFRYVVQAGDYDGDGISIGAGPTSLMGGTIQDDAGNDARRTFRALPQDGFHRVGARPPQVVDVSIVPSSARNYRLGDAIDIAVAFTDVVHVTGQPTLAVAVGAATRQAALHGGSGTATLTFRYVVQASDNDPDGISIAAGPASLAGAMIQGRFGNDAVRTFTALHAARHTVSGQAIAVSRVAVTSSPVGSTYLPGEAIVVNIVFDGIVHVTGQPTLALSIGAATRQAAFVTGSGTNQLVFGYVIQADDFDEDGISIGAGPGSLSAGTIQDRHGNDVLRDFEAKGADPSQRVGIAALPAQPVRTLTVGQAEVIDLAEVLGVQISFDCVDQCTDDANVAAASVAGRLLTIVPLAEGAATITIVGTQLQLVMEFPVVVQADPAEVAVLEHALAAVARGLLSGASNTLGKRLESIHRSPGASIGGRRIGTTPWPRDDQRWAQAATAGALGSHSAFGAGSADWSARQGMALDRLLGGSSFEMSLIADRGAKWAVWGAGDLHAFEGKPETGRYDGDMTSAYLGFDVQGQGWIAGAAFSRNSAEADYGFTSALGTGSGTVETTLNVLHPYVQWSLGQRGRVWAMAGVGVGEATFMRDSDRSAARPAPSDLTLRMGLAGLRSELLQFGGFELALRGDAGVATLATDDGPTALDGLAITAQRVRVGVEAGYALENAGGTLKPFLDIGGRFDGGDGQTGFGVEVAAGVRYRSATVGFEAKARTLAMHAADDYSETGASAMLMVTPGTGGRGLRFSLAPRWGGSSAGQELFWNQEEVFRGGTASSERRRDRDKWGVAARLGYGFGLRSAKGAVSPFLEYDLNQRDRQETRFGIGYVAEGARRVKFDVSGARVSSPHGTEQRWLLTLHGRL